MLCGRQEIYLVGGGNSAGQAALHFARYAAGVNMVVREDSLSVYMSEYLIDRIRAEPKVKVLLNTEVIALHGDRILQAITLRNNATGREWTAETSWLFLCLGGVPQTQWAAQAGVVCDSGGYIVTGSDLLKGNKPPNSWVLDRKPYAMETSLRENWLFEGYGLQPVHQLRKIGRALAPEGISCGHLSSPQRLKPIHFDW